jgi:hypothetical protein
MMPSYSNPGARTRNVVALIVAAGAPLISTACGSSATAPAPTGSLTVTITAPTNVTPAVNVTGPSGYNMMVTATTTLTGLKAGSYSVVAAPVTTANPIVATLATGVVTGSPANVTATGGPAAATATYAIRPGTGALWVSVYLEGGGIAEEYTESELASGGQPAPAGSAGGNGDFYEGIAFDANGNLWVANAGQQMIIEWAPHQFTGAGPLTPVVSITTATAVDGLAFDAAGDLWAVEPSSNTVVMYSPAQLAASGSPVPAVTIGAAGTSLAFPQGLAFDASGNLWVTNAGSGTAVEFTPGQLIANGTPTPAVTIGPYSVNAGNSLWGPTALAFDSNGNLWVANSSGPGQTLQSPTLVELAASSLAASGTPTPIHTIALINVRPFGLAFDASGVLWLSNLTANQLMIVVPGNPPVVTAGITVELPFALAFDPHASGLPIKP